MISFGPNNGGRYTTVRLELDGRPITYIDEQGDPAKIPYDTFTARRQPSQDDFQKLAERILKLERL